MIKLKTEKRDAGSNNSQLRQARKIPAIVYSQGKEGDKLVFDYVTFEKLYQQAGESSLVDLVMPDSSVKKVLIHEIQRDPVSHKITHVDFFEVDLTKKVTAAVELEFIGEAPIVKNEGGIFIKQLDQVEIECLPTDLIHNIEVDISGLDSFDSSIHIKDLKIPENIIITNNPEDVVAGIAQPRRSEEETPTTVVEGEVGKESGEEKKESESADEKNKDNQ